MSGLALIWNAERQAAELVVAGDETPDADLRTALIISLFTDRRAGADDLLPDGGGDRRGWWADLFPADEGDLIGSRLWLLARGKRRAEDVRLAQDYALEAIQWLVDAGVAGSVEVEATATGDTGIALTVIVTRPDGPARKPFDFLWEPR